MEALREVDLYALGLSIYIACGAIYTIVCPTAERVGLMAENRTCVNRSKMRGGVRYIQHGS